MTTSIHKVFRQLRPAWGFLGLNITLALVVAWIVTADWSLFLLVPVAVTASLAEAALWQRIVASRSEESSGSRRLVDAMYRGDDRRKSSIRDDTTGLYTRWYLDHRLLEEAARCQRYEHSMAVIVLRVGNVAISTFSTDGWQSQSQDAAQRVASVIRNVDLSAALSPFEFAICLVHCNREGAMKALDRLLGSMRDLDCEAGIVVYPDEGCDPDAMIDLAKARLRPWKSSIEAA